MDDTELRLIEIKTYIIHYFHKRLQKLSPNGEMISNISDT